MQILTHSNAKLFFKIPGELTPLRLVKVFRSLVMVTEPLKLPNFFFGLICIAHFLEKKSIFIFVSKNKIQV